MRPCARSASVSATSTETVLVDVGPSRTTPVSPALFSPSPHPPRQRSAGAVTSQLGEKPAFQPKEKLLALEPAGVPDEAPARPDDAVARNDDGDRVAVERASDRPGCPRLADAGGEPSVGVHLAVRNPLQLGQHQLLERGQATEVDGQVEVVAATVEVLVELALDIVHGARGAQDARTVEAGEPLDLGFGIGVEGDLADSPLGRGEKKRAGGGLGHVVGDIEERLGGSAVSEGAIGLDWKGHVILLRAEEDDM